MVDYTNCKFSRKMYGGLACEKVGIIKDGIKYLVKMPNKLSDKNLKNVEIKYANDVYSEYIASCVAGLFMETHMVTIGLYENKICAICKDFVVGDYALYSYQELKNSSKVATNRINGEYTDGTDPDIDTAIDTLKTNRITKGNMRLIKDFWTQFIIDAINGNPDRNNGNWGVLVNDEALRFAPIYDNGTALSSKLSDSQIYSLMTDEKRMVQVAYGGFRCFFEDKGSKINPFHYLESAQNKDAVDALRVINLDVVVPYVTTAINALDISAERKKFYIALYMLRIEELKRIQLSLNSKISEKARSVMELINKL